MSKMSKIVVLVSKLS